MLARVKAEMMSGELTDGNYQSTPSGGNVYRWM